jgi:hypothetical protein
MASDELPEKLLGLIHSMANTALALPPNEREGWLARNRQKCFEEVSSANVTIAQAHDWADNVDKWVRALIEVMANSGGSAGGTA